MSKFLNYTFFFFLLFFSACTITQEFHFNNDFSGTNLLSIDFTETKKNYPNIKFDNIKKGFDEAKLDSVTKAFQKIDTMGVSNFRFGWIDSSKIFFFGYDFKNLNVLNELQISSYLNNRETLTREDIGDFKYFELKGKNTLIYNHLVEDSLGFKNDKSQKKYKMNFIFEFDRKIKKVDNPKVRLSYDRKKATIKTNAYKMYQSDFKRSIKFKLEQQ